MAGRPPTPHRDLIATLGASGLDGPHIRERLLEMGIDVPLSTVQKHMGKRPPTPAVTPPPSVPAPSLDLPAWGAGQSEAVLSTAYRELLLILRDPLQQPAHRIKAGETAGQLAVLGAELERGSSKEKKP